MNFSQKQLEAYAAIENLKPGQVAILLRSVPIYKLEGVRFVERLANNKFYSEYITNNEEIEYYEVIPKKSCFMDEKGSFMKNMKEFDENHIELELIGVL